jgi:hypothetical protein
MDCETCEKRDECPIKDAKEAGDIRKVAIDLVESKGFRVLFNTPYCEQFHDKHSNCVSCEGEQGCRKVACVLRAFKLVGVLADNIVAAVIDKTLEEG